MKFWNLFILGLIALGLVSCAPEPGTSNLKVSVAAVTGSENFPGGLFLLGRSTDGFEFLNRVPASDSIELELANGQYDFLVIGWDGSQFYEGSPHCGALRNIELAGGELPLNFNVTVSGCHHRDINGVGAMTAGLLTPIPQLVFRSCAGLQYYLAMGQDPPSDLLCDGTDDMFSGGEKYFQISLIEKTPDGAVKYDSFSACKEVNSASGLNLPIGSTAAKFPVLINAYTDASCTQNKNSYLFSKGLISVSDGMRGKISEQNLSDVMTEQNIYLSRRECNPLHQGITATFASKRVENGTDVHLICNKEQFWLIGQGTESAAGDSYELGQDINMNGAATVGNLDGSLYGNGYTLYDGDQPIFDLIQTIASEDIRVSDLNIVNYNISDNSRSEIGIFANKVLIASGTSTHIEINDLFIDSSSKIEVIDPSIDVNLGGLIGEIDFITSNNGSQKIDLRYIESHANIKIENANNQANIVGGLVGKFWATIAGNDKSRIESSSVGNNIKNPHEDIGVVKLEGDDRSEKIGGMVGQAKNIKFNEVATRVSIYGKSYLGGLIGDIINSDNTIHDVYTDTVFIPQVNASSRMGGVIGGIANYGVKIEGAFSKVALSSSHKTDQVGGFIGGSGSSPSSTQIYKSKANVNFDFDGQDVGGAIGLYEGTATNSSVTSTGFYCERCLIEGDIHAKSSNLALNKYRGGFAGRIYGGRFEMSIANLDAVTGYQGIAGGFGKAIESSIFESYIKVNEIVFDDKYGAEIIGELELSQAMSGNYYKSIISDSQLYTPSIDCYDSGSYCGKIVGYIKQVSSHTVSGSAFTKIISTSDILLASDGSTQVGDSSMICGADTSGGCSSLDSYGSQGACSGMGSPYGMTDSDGKCLLSFELAWKKYTKDAIKSASKYSAGNFFQPFPINNEQEWGSLGSDKFLMRSTFELQRDLKFVSGTSDPVSGLSGDNVFSGRIIPNGHSINNLNVTGRGLIQVADGATIGWYDDPLKIYGLNINCDGYDCGIIGNAANSDIFIQSYKTEINGSSSYYVGGIVGYANGRLTLKQSSFDGTIIGSGESYGGLIGYIDVSTESVEIEESRVKSTQIKAGNTIGSFIGTINSGTVKLSDSYVVLKGDGVNQTLEELTETKIGLFAGANYGSFEIKNTFVDIKNASLPSSYSAGKLEFIALSNAANCSSCYILDSLSPNSVGFSDTPTGGNTYSLDTSSNKADDILSDDFNRDSDDGYSTWWVDSTGAIMLWWE